MMFESLEELGRMWQGNWRLKVGGSRRNPSRISWASLWESLKSLGTKSGGGRSSWKDWSASGRWIGVNQGQTSVKFSSKVVAVPFSFPSGGAGGGRWTGRRRRKWRWNLEGIPFSGFKSCESSSSSNNNNSSSNNINNNNKNAQVWSSVALFSFYRRWLRRGGGTEEEWE